MARQKFSMFSGSTVFSLRLLRHWMSLFWQNPQTHAAAHSVGLIFYEFQIICKTFLTSILEPPGRFRVCLLQGQANLKYWHKEESFI